jgi:hypothetical protein
MGMVMVMVIVVVIVIFMVIMLIMKILFKMVIVIAMELVVELLVILTLDGRKPRTIDAEGHGRIEATALHRQHRRTRPQRLLQPQPHPLQRRPIQAIGPAHHHQIGGLQLLLEQLLYRRGVIRRRGVIQAGIRLALGLQAVEIGHHGSGGQGLSIHHRHHPAHPGATADGRPAKGGYQGLRQS